MPGRNGSSIISRHAKKPEYSKIPFILCSSREDSIGKYAMKNGAYSYLKKPFNISKIKQVVEKALSYSNLSSQ